MLRPLSGLSRALTRLTILAAALALVVPSGALAAHSDLLLALLVLATALGISFSDLARLRDHLGAVAVLSVLPPVLLGAVAWGLGRPFAAPVRDGLLAVGLSSSEVASVGLVALAGADATVALGALTGSLVLAAVLGPVAVGAIGGGGQADAGRLLGRFALVVLVPLAVGVAARTWPRSAERLKQLDGPRDGVAALTVAVLVYAALSGTKGRHHLGAALLASLAFLLVSGALAELWRRRAGPVLAVPGALAIGMRDFAVAAALATQAFGSPAGAVPGVYGVIMLIAVCALRPAACPARRPGPREARSPSSCRGRRRR